MKYNYSFTYLTCQSCTAKIHCAHCADELAHRLCRESGICEVCIDIPNRTLSLQADGWDEAALLDLMEDIGIFVD